MPTGKPRKLKLRSEKLPKVGTISVIHGPGNLSTFEPPVQPAKETPKQTRSS